MIVYLFQHPGFRAKTHGQKGIAVTEDGVLITSHHSTTVEYLKSDLRNKRIYKKIFSKPKIIYLDDHRDFVRETGITDIVFDPKGLVFSRPNTFTDYVLTNRHLHALMHREIPEGQICKVA